MFGRHPRLPVDFLLGTPEAVQHADTLEEWVQTHQESVKLTQEHVRQKSEEQARQRNQNHNARVNDAGVEEGQLVYLRNHVQGRNKIQDHWNANVFRVTRSPSGTGVVYTVAPLDGGPIRHVHRSELRAVPEGVRPEPVRSTHAASRANLPSAPTPSEEGPSEDADMVYYEDEPMGEPGLPRATTPDEMDDIPEAMPGSMPPSLRRSARSTAGQHSNPYRLPLGSAIRNEEQGRVVDGEHLDGQA